MVDDLRLCGATVTVMAPDEGEASAAASDHHSQTMAELQFALGEGPVPDAYRSGRPVLVADLAAINGRWVGFTPAALGAGVSGVFAFPLRLGATRLGVLACYSGLGHTLRRQELRRCQTAADAATYLLLSSGSDGDGDGADPDMQVPLRIRTEVYQAQGMLKVALQVSLTDALARLRAMAYAEGIDINEMAGELVSGRRPMPRKNDDSH